MAEDLTVGQKVAQWRSEKGLSERGAAEMIGVSQPTLRAVERDEIKRIGLNIARKFVAACDGAISLDDFPEAEASPSTAA